KCASPSTPRPATRRMISSLGLLNVWLLLRLTAVTMAGMGSSGSFPLDVRVANDAAVFVILFAQISTKFCAARSYGIKHLDHKLLHDFRHLYRRGEPAGNLGDRFLRRFSRRERRIPSVHFMVLVTGLGNGG